MWILSENEGSPLLGPQQRSAKMAVKYGEGYTEKYQGKGLVSHQSGLSSFIRVVFLRNGLSPFIGWSFIWLGLLSFIRVVFVQGWQCIVRQEFSVRGEMTRCTETGLRCEMPADVETCLLSVKKKCV